METDIEMTYTAVGDCVFSGGKYSKGTSCVPGSRSSRVSRTEERNAAPHQGSDQNERKTKGGGRIQLRIIG